MDGFFLRPIDLAALNLLIVSGLVGWRLLAMRPNRKAGRWLLLFFGATLSLTVLWMLAGTRLDGWRFVALHAWGLIWTGGAVSLIQYAYRLGGIDPERKEAHLALVIGLSGLALATCWAGFQVYQLTPGGHPTTNTLPVDVLVFLGFVWALVVMLRQMYHAWRTGRSFSMVSHLVAPVIGTLLLVSAGVISIAGLLSGQLIVIDFGRIFLVGVGINLIGFNYLIYWDSIGPRITRLVGVSLLMIQIVFSFLGFIYIVQFIGDRVAALPVPTPAAPYRPLTPDEILIRRELHGWTLPIFAFQLAMSFLAMGLFVFSSWRMRTMDRFLENMSISPRQREIIALLADGLNNQEIARELVISENTVKYHLRGIYETLDISDRDALAQWYLDRLADERTTQ